MFYSNLSKRSALAIAARNGSLEIASALVAAGADVRATDDRGYTPLHVASMHGHRELVELLIAHGAEINAEAEDGCTPLYLAASSEHRDIARLLIDYGAISEPDIAVMLGETELVKQYLDCGLDPNSQISKGLNKGDSWLITAIGRKYKNKELLTLLLQRGARVNDNNAASETPALHRVANLSYRGVFPTYRDIGEILIAYGADVNARCKWGTVPLHFAARFGDINLVELLVECGARVNFLDKEGNSPLFDAAKCQEQETVKFLLSRGAEVNLVNHSGETPLIAAFHRKGSDEIVKELVSYGADVNLGKYQGKSALYIAVSQENQSIVELLLSKGAKPDF